MSASARSQLTSSALVAARAAWTGLAGAMRSQVALMWGADGPPEFVLDGKVWTAAVVLPDGDEIVAEFAWDGNIWRTTVPEHATKYIAVVHGYLLRGLLHAAAGPEATVMRDKSKRAMPLTETIVPVEVLTYKEPLSIIVASRLGRALAKPELAALKVIERLYAGKSRNVSEADLREISGAARGWSYMYYEPWPRPPDTVWQAWLYLMHLTQRLNLKVPEFLAAATPQQDVDNIVREWQRQTQIAQWQNFLQRPPPREATPEVQSPVLRARLKDRTLRLESCAPGTEKFTTTDPGVFNAWERAWQEGRLELDPASSIVWAAWRHASPSLVTMRYADPGCRTVLRALMRSGVPGDRFIGLDGSPVSVADAPARWRIDAPPDSGGDYRWSLENADGSPLTGILAAVDGDPSLLLTATHIIPGPPLMGLQDSLTGPDKAALIPAPALETAQGTAFLDVAGAPLPERMAGRIRRITRRILMRAELHEGSSIFSGGETLSVKFTTVDSDGREGGRFAGHGWENLPAHKPTAEGGIVRVDDRALAQVSNIVSVLELQARYGHDWERRVNKSFPAQFAAWLATVPDGVVLELDPALNSLHKPDIQGSLSFDFEESSTGIDWFDLRVTLNTGDTELTAEETALLLKAKGGFVRLGAKGWRRLSFVLTEEEEKELADLGLSSADLNGQPQRLHALQLAGSSTARRALPPERVAAIERTAAEIRTRSTPDVPASLKADLRPYQRDGYHFLSYLTANRFGGILADDMGLGKTVQALAWLLWLRAQEKPKHPALVVCPKSVSDNWVSESARFAPTLRVVRLERGASGKTIKAARKKADLVVLNYTQLRLLESDLKSTPWHATILDEAQAIKNPQSLTATAACALTAPHRLALSGTPIENRLLDLWSLMNFAMPGVLGNRTSFQKLYDSKTDPLARRRLSARVRPFVLRRTKGEVARDLPDKIEEDLHCELEGVQATLYKAELKRARKALLGLSSGRELDKARFHILSSLLRLRQICCHPALVAPGTSGDSCKLNALLDLLEPLMEEGHKVLVFSQFVEMLNLIRTELETRAWPHFILTGQTENRGSLVNDFQTAKGAAVFLISLRAGGFGLNLTAASYVVLFDPWWNPAVENQAIDRTHRIGQTQKVIAYRLLVKETIEEKIRTLQQQKSALAGDILGEESFARALTLDDFQFLFAE